MAWPFIRFGPPRFRKLLLAVVLLFAVTKYASLYQTSIFGTPANRFPGSAGQHGRPLGAGYNIAVKHNESWNSLQQMLLWHSPKAGTPQKTSDLKQPFPPFGEIKDEPLEQCFSMSEEDVLEMQQAHAGFI